MNRRRRQLVIASLILFFVVWDLRAIFTDNAVGAYDTLLQSSLELEGFVDWLRVEKKGPLAPLVLMGLDHIIDFELITARVMVVIAHGAALWLVYLMAARVSSSWIAGLAALVVCGVCPGIYGWFREEYHEGLVAAVVLATLAQLLTRRLTTRRALLLGITVGLGLLLKPSYAVFTLAPGAVFVVVMIRRGHLRPVLIGLATAAVVAGWWYAMAWETLREYASRSSSGGELAGVWEKLRNWPTHLPGGSLLVYASLASAALCAVTRRVRPVHLLLLVACVVGSTLMLSLGFAPLWRYSVPALPVAAVLVGLGAAELRRLAVRFAPPGAVTVILLLVATVLLVQFGRDNVQCTGLKTATSSLPDREMAGGMICPDARPYRKAGACVRWITRDRCPVLFVMEAARSCPQMDLIWRPRGVDFPAMDDLSNKQRLKLRKRACVVVCHGPGEVVPLMVAHAVNEQRRMLRQWLPASDLKTVASFADPDGSRLSIVQLTPRP